MIERTTKSESCRYVIDSLGSLKIKSSYLMGKPVILGDYAQYVRLLRVVLSF